MSEAETLLHKGLHTLNLACNSTTEQRLLEYLRLLQHWNKTHNLTAITELTAMVTHHLLDSLTLLPYLPRGRLLDVGSGAGLPGLAIALVEPERSIVLLDSSAKKTAFLQHVVIHLGLPQVTVVHSRVEDYTSQSCFPCVVSRAVGTTNKLLLATKHLVCSQGRVLMMKGKYPDAELAELTLPYEVIPVAVPGLLAERHLLLLRNSNE